MKKLLLSVSIILLTLATGCSKDEGSTNKISLQSLNIGDAKSIFKKSSDGTRSGSGDGSYWKIDKSGNESKLVLTDDVGNIHNSDFQIKNLVKLSDDFLLLYTDGFVPTGGEGNEQTIKHFLFIANTTTERLFEIPGYNIYTHSGDEMFDAVQSIVQFSFKNDIKQAADGNIYMLSGNDNIIKFDTNKLTFGFCLPDGQEIYSFDITSDNFIAYDNYAANNFKVKCTGSRIVPIAGTGFILNDEIYSHENKHIYHWKRISDNDLEKIEVCEFYEKEYDREIEINIYNVIENHVKNTVIFHTNGALFFEFDGINTPTLIETIPNEFIYFGTSYDNIETTTKDALYMFEDNKLLKLDLATYQSTTVPTTDVEIQSMTSDIRESGFSFTGISYTNGKNIIGNIDSNDKITTTFTSDDGSKLVNLIEIF